MRLCHALLSPTWGMHQYTADLANRMSRVGHNVHVVTTRRVPRDRYAAGVELHTPVDVPDTGFSLEGMRGTPAYVRRSLVAIRRVDPDLVHITGPHLCNPLLLRALRRRGLPVLHTLHDLHAHAGAAYGPLLYAWNGWVRRQASHVLVHGRCHRRALLDGGLAPDRVTCTPLTHLFAGHRCEQALRQSMPPLEYGPWALFLGRLEAYKGLGVLVEAVQSLDGRGPSPAKPVPRLVIAGPGRLVGVVRDPVPEGIEVREGLVADEEAIDLFRRCGLLVLPYVEASQSALVAAAYFFHKPVVVTRVGALPEYVVEGETGRIVPPRDPQALAEVLRAALSDPGRLARLGRAGRVWYERRREEEGARLQALYARLARRP
jgi:glycosyltransferase involved in cell wall biosynthesis